MEAPFLSKRDHIQAVGIRLRQLIDALGISYTEAAADMGIPKNQLGNWMRGDRSYPQEYSLYLFCRKRGVNTDWIYLGDPSGLPYKVASVLLADPAALADQTDAGSRAYAGDKAG